MPSESQNQPVSFSMVDQIAVIQVDDGKVNALSHDVVAALDAALQQAEEAKAGAVMLAGRPGRFCAGFDLSVMSQGMDAARDLVRKGAEMMLRLFTFPAPVVMACTGHAMAGGAVLLLTADHCVGVEGAFKLGLNEVAIGMPVPIFALELARHRLSPRQFTAATILAHVYDPAGALDAGYLHELVPPAELEQRAMDRARALASTLKPRSFGRTKEHARGAIARHISETLEADLAKFTVG